MSPNANLTADASAWRRAFARARAKLRRGRRSRRERPLAHESPARLVAPTIATLLDVRP